MDHHKSRVIMVPSYAPFTRRDERHYERPASMSDEGRQVVSDDKTRAAPRVSRVRLVVPLGHARGRRLYVTVELQTSHCGSWVKGGKATLA